MSSTDDLFQLASDPGIARDGTELDSSSCGDGDWIRFYRGKPRKMGGYRAMSQLADGPVRSILVDSRNNVSSAHTFSQWGVARLQFSQDGAGGSLEDRTPLGFVPNPQYTWSQDRLASSTGGAYTALLALASPDLNVIDNDASGQLYTGDMSTSDRLTPVSTASGLLMASGGVCVLHPFAVVYGSNGLIKNSNANDISAAGWTPGGGSFANEANVAGTKFIHGAPVRGGGQSPAGLFWGLDTLVRMSFVGGTTLWSYDTISKPTSIMSKKCVVECDGKFFWIGTDRFLMYNGVVQEIANPMNSDYFFNSINYAQRNKVWGTKVTRWGEIWWFYPRGDATECNAAIIYNYRENTWYDAAKARSAGGHVQTFRFPVWSGPEDVKVTTSIPVGQTLVLSAATASGSPTLTFLSTAGIAVGRPISGFGIPAGTTVTAFTSTTITMSANSTAIMPIGTQVAVTAMTKGFIPGETLTGSGGATGRVVRASPFAINVDNFVGTFAAGDTLTGSFGGTATATATPFAQTLETLYQHEVGKDKVVGTAVSAINSSVTSRDFGFANANPISDATNTHDLMTRVLRLDPDYAQVGDLTVEVLGKSFTKDPYRVLSTNVIHPNTAFLDIRDSQERILRIRVTSNSQGGDFQQGRVAIGIEPGDERSTITT